jgi:hypothetical protein
LRVLQLRGVGVVGAYGGLEGLRRLRQLVREALQRLAQFVHGLALALLDGSPFTEDAEGDRGLVADRRVAGREQSDAVRIARRGVLRHADDLET